MSPDNSTAITNEYTAMIPAMTTGIKDCCESLISIETSHRFDELAFIMRSGLNVPTPAIPMPDFAVPYAAPAPMNDQRRVKAASPTTHIRISSNSC